MIVTLAGGGGGARLAGGLAEILDPGDLMVVTNTGDDFEHLGLSISPDVDTILYTLAGLIDPERGWGRAGESWNMMASLERLGGDTWFRLGDHDVALHIERTRRLRSGEPLSAVTADLAQRLGVAQLIAPMSDDAVRTIVDTVDVPLGFQDYFVGRQCAPVMSGVRFEGAENALPLDTILAAIRSSATEAIIIGPSNPYLSIGPILAIPALRAAIAQASAPVIAVSPIVGGRAIKGPTAKIMRELGIEPTVPAIAAHYGGLIDGIVIDRADERSSLPRGLDVLVTDTIMDGREARCRLAHDTLAFARTLRRGRQS